VDAPHKAAVTPVDRVQRPNLTAQSIPALPRHVRLKHDKTRDRWVILVPERVLVPDDIAVVVLQQVDGKRSIHDIAETLSAVYDAGTDAIEADIIPLLQDLADKGFLRTVEKEAPLG
jgi:pyrroloquinoline quinone biosynthesis protein D